MVLDQSDKLLVLHWDLSAIMQPVEKNDIIQF